ncbi:MAG: outer membrane protein assembly factor BamB [marine bacterium B5-7]|nr:MAG: outer membrane protein assembly factor BamB [marine bacterium B5-7]
MRRIFSLCSFLLVLSGCAQMMGGTDNAPKPTALKPIKQQVSVKEAWSVQALSASKQTFPLAIAHAANSLYTANHQGDVAAVNQTNGELRWKTHLKQVITAGPAASDALVVLGTNNGEVFALSAKDGHVLWRYAADTTILASPVIDDDSVLVKSMNGTVTRLNATTGKKMWAYEYGAPALILRRSSTPLITAGVVVSGFSNGKVAAFNMNKGDLLWEQRIAAPEGNLAIERMVDIDATPVIDGNMLYVATYQGRIVAMQLPQGEVKWQHKLSTFTGLAVDTEHVLVTDADSQVWAFDRANGHVLWRQEALKYRHITAPSLLGLYMIVADGDGYIHWLSTTDGHEVAREQAGKHINTPPLVIGDHVYVLTQGGELAAYSI